MADKMKLTAGDHVVSRLTSQRAEIVRVFGPNIYIRSWVSPRITASYWTKKKGWHRSLGRAHLASSGKDE